MESQAGLYLQTIRMQRPVVGPLDIAESCLCHPLRLPFVPGVKFDGGLADLRHLANFAEDILGEADDERGMGLFEGKGHWQWSAGRLISC